MKRTPWAVCLAAVVPIIAVTGQVGASQGTRFRSPVESELGVVVSPSAQASAAGLAVLNEGGNAIDAAVATVFALGVARPDLTGIGGGGFLVYRSASGAEAALDFREFAPAALVAGVQRDKFEQGGFGHHFIGVPGQVAGLAEARSRFGTKSLAELIAPAVKLARQGIVVTPELSAFNTASAAELRLFPAAAEIYLIGGATPYPAGSMLIQDDYADSLQLIADGGPDAFYTGEIAGLIVKDMEDTRDKEEAGIGYPADNVFMTSADLAAYRPVWRNPVVGKYRGHHVIGMPPPSSGGVAVQEMLNIVEGFPLAEFGPSSADHLHVLAESQKIALADRAAYAADPDFEDVPVAKLTSKRYAEERRREISLDQAKAEYPAGDFAPKANGHQDEEQARKKGATAHVSVIDRWDNAVSVTSSLEAIFGSKVVAEGAGFLLNNQLGDFHRSGPNRADGHKRPRSSMTPTIIVNRGRPVLVVGGAGGPTIIMGSLQAVVNVVDFGMNVARAVDAERVDAGFFDQNQMVVEDARVPIAAQAQLRDKGHSWVSQGEYGAFPFVQAAGLDSVTGHRLAFSDPRSEWGATGQDP